MTKNHKIKNKKDPPNPEQLMRIMTDQPSSLEIELGQHMIGKQKSWTAIAKHLGCSMYQLRKTARAMENHEGTDFTNMNIWKKKSAMARWRLITPETKAFILDRDTLKDQVGYSFTARAGMANVKFGCSLTERDISKLYYRNRITLQKFSPFIAPMKYKSNEQQIEELDLVKK